MRPTLVWRGKREVAEFCQERRGDAFPAAVSRVPDPLGWQVLAGDNYAHMTRLAHELGDIFDLVYLDPPYNCGHPYSVFNDSASDAADLAWLRTVLGEVADDLSQTERWLSLLYGRLLLVDSLLTAGGTVIASIDSCEVHNLAVLFSEVFAGRGRVDEYAWPPFSWLDTSKLPGRMNYLLVCAPAKQQHTLPVAVLGSRFVGMDDIESELGRRPSFDTPKPMRFLRHLLLEFAGSGALVLDPYAGSGSLGVAMTTLNRTDGGNRRCVLIERSERAIAVLVQRANALAQV